MNRRMKNVKRFLSGTMAALLLFGAVPEGMPMADNISEVQAASVKLSAKKMTLTVGQKKTLKIIGTKKKVIWTSSKKKVASVSKTGKITAKKAGTAVITAKAAKKKYSCRVTVKKKKAAPSKLAVKGIALNRSSADLHVNEKLRLNAAVAPVNATNKIVVWQSSNNAVATVSQSGEITAISSGTAVITVKSADGGYTAACNIRVINPIFENYMKLKAYIYQFGGTNKYGNKFIKWEDTANDNSFAIVYENNTGNFNFICTSEYNSAMYSYDMTIDVSNLNSAYPRFLLAFRNSYMGCEAYAEVKIAEYDGKKDLYFILESGTGVTQSSIQKLANSGLRLSFSGWSILLKYKVGLSFPELGFYSYK